MDAGPIIAGVAIVPTMAVLAFTAAAEAALQRASDVRIRALAARGDERARQIAGSVERPLSLLGPLTTARVLSAALIVTLAVYIGIHAYQPGAGAIGVGMAAGAAVGLLQMTVGMLASRRPELTALRLAGVMRLTRIVFAVPAFILALPARGLARSVRAVAPRGRDDILTLLEREEAAGGVREDEQRMMRGIIALEDKTVREIMVPRIDMVAADIDDTVEDVAEVINERGFSRVPIYRENIDDIVGIAYAKDLLQAVVKSGKGVRLSDLLRQPAFIPESKKLDSLLREMRESRTHVAIVIDEYGGTAGLVTIEDLLEEIVGEIEDEYDIARPPMERLSDDEVVLDAATPAGILEELFDLDAESDDYDTVGGFLNHHLGRLPTVGEEVDVGDLRLRVLSMSGRRVRRLRILRQHPVETSAASGK